MDISSTRPGMGSLTPAKTATRGKGGNALESGSAEATREASRKLQETQHQIDDARRQADVEMDHLKLSHDQEYIAESARSQAAVDSLKTQGYEALRDLQRQQQAELNRVRREGERELSQAKTYYDNSIKKTETEGARELETLRASVGGNIDHEQKLSKTTLETLKSENVGRIEIAREMADAAYSNVTNASRAQYGKIQESSDQATARATEHFQQQFQGAVHEQAQIIGNLSERATDQIREIRQDTAQKLAAYTSRQRDPFYKMMELDVKIEDAGEQYVMTATIPEYEQKNISVLLKGNQLVLSGHRRNEEKLDLAPGHTQGTASFQSFHESFPLPVPVDGKKLTRSFEGDQLTVTVPKKPLVYEAKVADAPAKRSKVQKPQFPDNLPHVEREDDGRSTEKARAQASRKTTGSRTLS